MNHQIVTTSNKCSVEISRELDLISSIAKPIELFDYRRQSVTATLETDLKLNQGDFVDMKVVVVKPKISGKEINKTITRRREEYTFSAVVERENNNGYELTVTGEISLTIT